MRDSMSRRHYVGLAITSLFACYTHTYAMLSCVYIYLLLAIWLFRRKCWKNWLLSGLSVAVLYLPWLLVLMKQTANRVDNYWIEHLTWKEIIAYPDYWFQSGSDVPHLTWMFIVLLLLGLVECIHRREIIGGGGSSSSVAYGTDGNCGFYLGNTFFYCKIYRALHGALCTRGCDWLLQNCETDLGTSDFFLRAVFC